jgi:hypothetical protein
MCALPVAHAPTLTATKRSVGSKITVRLSHSLASDSANRRGGRELAATQTGAMRVLVRVAPVSVHHHVGLMTPAEFTCRTVPGASCATSSDQTRGMGLRVLRLGVRLGYQGIVPDEMRIVICSLGFTWYVVNFVERLGESVERQMTKQEGKLVF